MQAYIKCLLSVKRNGVSTAISGTTLLGSLFLGIALLFSIALSVTAWASNQPDAKAYEDSDARWTPWIGSWRLISNAVNSSGSDVKEEYMLIISSSDDRKSVTMKGYKGETFLSEEKITVDGEQHPLTDDKCTGWYSYSWSESGKRLLFNSESSCKGTPLRIISGMSIINDAGEWVDIQLLKSGEEKAITIRRYHNVDNDTANLIRKDASLSIIPRSSAGTNFSIDEIIELSGKVEPEVLEAALIEMHKPFPINSKQLLHLADSKVPAEITDLMVALSFPDKFMVERMSVSPVQKLESQKSYVFIGLPVDECPYDDLIFPWHWGLPGCELYYDYWSMGWGVWPGWYYPFGWRYDYREGGYGLNTGKLVGDHGYTRVSPVQPGRTPRYAHPRNAPEGQQPSSSPALSSSSEIFSSEPSGANSSGSSSGSGSKTPCASPSGYSSGNCD